MDPNEFRDRCKGIVPVQYCPYKANGSLDVDGLKKNTEFLVDFAENGSKDLVVMTNGSTTEFYANSIEEQKAVINTVVDTVAGRVPVVAGASQAGTRETIRMAKHVQEAGADCAMIVLPYYHTPTKEGVYKHYEAIANAVDIAIMIYNNPDVSGALIDPFLMKRLSEIENVVALKDNTPNVAEYAWKSFLIKPEDMALLNGLGEMHFVGSAAYGYKYRGFVTFIANFAPSLSYAVYEAVKEKDFNKAQIALEKELPLYDIVGKLMNSRESPSIIPAILRTNYMYMGVGKACMNLMGLSGRSLRLPLEDITEKEREELRGILEKIGLI